MKLPFVRCAELLLLSVLLTAAGCRNADRSGIAVGGAGGGEGGRGGSGGRGGTRGGSGGTAGSMAGTGGAGGGTGGATGGTGGGGSGGTSEAGAELGPAEVGEAGTPDVPPMEVGPMPDMAPPDMPIVPGGCGDQIATANTTGAAESIVIAPDGTVYFSQSTSANFIGRIRPGMPVERNWLASGGQVLGLTYDPKRKWLYAGRRTGGAAVLKIDLNMTPPMVSTLAAAEASINGLTLGEDEAIYYTDETGRNINRVTYFGVKSRVNATALPGNPNGLAFGPKPNPSDMADTNAYLYVVYFSGNNQVTRLRLTNGGETQRTAWINNIGAAGADGAAFDERGRLYVTAGGQLRRITAPAMGMPTVDMMMASANAASVEFGVGALNCNDVYVGTSNAGIRRYTLDAKGWNVPWHRP